MPLPSDLQQREKISHDRREIIIFLGALCLFFSTIEYLVPKPLPFFRLGLANLPLLIGLRFLRTSELVLVLVLKVLGQGLINGTLASYVFLFSLAGSSSSLVIMCLVYRWGGRRVSLVGVSLMGALSSSVLQIILSVVIVFGPSAWLIAPLSLVSGIVSGFIMGLFSNHFVCVSWWFSSLENRYKKGWENLPSREIPKKKTAQEPISALLAKRQDYLGKHLSPTPRFIAGILALLGYLLLNDPLLKVFLVVFFALLALLAGKKLRWGYFLILVSTVIFFHLLNPWGKLLWQLGPFQLTAGALHEGFNRGISLIGMVFLSLATVRPEVTLPGGDFLGRTFLHFEGILEGKKRLSRRNFFRNLDVLLFDRFDPFQKDFGLNYRGENRSPLMAHSRHISFLGFLLLGSVVLLPWSFWLISLLENK